LASAQKGLSPASDADPAPEEKTPHPSNRKEASLEEEVQKVADRFDYTAVRQGDVYLLTKRYTSPDDLPEVTVEECWRGLKNFRGLAADNNQANVTNIRNFFHSDRYRDGLQNMGFRESILAHNIVQNFYFQSHWDRTQAAFDLREKSLPVDPVFHWKTIGRSPVLGYDTQYLVGEKAQFVPVSDLDRSVVIPFGTPLPRAGFSVRTEFTVPDPDPTDPATLPEETKRFLDDNGRSSHAIPLSEAVTTLKGRAAPHVVYKVDPIYAAKHVTLAGVDRLSPEIIMQSLAAVYGLSVAHNKDDSVVLTDPQPLKLPDPSIFVLFRQYGPFIRSTFPAPIYRVMHARFLAGRTKPANQEGPELLQFKTQYEFQRVATSYRNSAMRLFRYVVEPQIKAQPDGKLALSRLGERARLLFTLAQTASAYADTCEVADIPLPPYITHRDDFRANVSITGQTYRAQDGTIRRSLSLTYVDPNSGVGFGPVRFVDAPLDL